MHTPALDLDELVLGRLLHVGDQIGQIVGGHDVLAIAELDDPLEHLIAVLGGQHDAELGQVLVERGFPRKLAERITPGAAEAARHQLCRVQVALGVPIGVDARGLGVDVAADDRRIRGDLLAGVGRDERRDRGQAVFADSRVAVAVVVDRGDDFRQRRIARSFAHAVHAGVDTAGAGADRRQAIRGGEAVVVVAVVLEVDGGKRRGHQADEARHVLGRENAEGVREVDPGDPQLAQLLDHREDVVEGVADAVGPVLEVDVDGEALAAGVADRVGDPGAVLGGLEAELLEAMAFGALRQQVDHLAAGLADPVDGFLAVAVAQHLDALDQARGLRPFRDGPGALHLPHRDAGRGDLDAVDLQVGEQHARELQLLGRRIGDVRGLLAVAQRRVHHRDVARLDGRGGDLLVSRLGNGGPRRRLPLDRGSARAYPLAVAT